MAVSYGREASASQFCMSNNIAAIHQTPADEWSGAAGWNMAQRDIAFFYKEKGAWLFYCRFSTNYGAEADIGPAINALLVQTAEAKKAAAAAPATPPPAIVANNTNGNSSSSSPPSASSPPTNKPPPANEMWPADKKSASGSDLKMSAASIGGRRATGGAAAVAMGLGLAIAAVVAAEARFVS
jgi:hypothetical protein